MRTFAVSRVTPATKPLRVIPYYEAATQFLGGRVESCSQYHGQLVADVKMHPLIETLHRAFDTHRPVSLSPDVIWLTLTQGLARHINANAEQLRDQFVQHQGKKKISVRRDDFVKGSPENPWPEVFSELSAAIEDHIGEAHGLIVADFSTTGPVERAASELVLMDALQAYFAYEVCTMCGIPSITLEGTVGDWQRIADRTREFGRLGLDWWVAALEPLLNQFVAAASGKIDREFWDSIYKWHGAEGSGTNPYITGWILNFFPYLTPLSREPDSHSSSPASYCRNPWINSWPSKHEGLEPDRIPHLPARVPFKWEYYEIEYDMEFIGGLLGVRQDPDTLCLRPEIGWGVWETGAEVRKQQSDADVRIERFEAEREAEVKRMAVNNHEPQRRFDDAKSLGLHVHEIYRAKSSSTASCSRLEESEQNQLLLDATINAYKTNSEFQKMWDIVYAEPPAPLHTNWLAMWKRN